MKVAIFGAWFFEWTLNVQVENSSITSYIIANIIKHEVLQDAIKDRGETLLTFYQCTDFKPSHIFKMLSSFLNRLKKK